MIWSLDICTKRNMSVINQIRVDIDPEKRRPCIYVVTNNLLLIYGTGTKITIDFCKKDVDCYITNHIQFEDIEYVKKLYWGSINNKELSESFVTDFSKTTEILCKIVYELYEDVLDDNLKQATSGHYSYNGCKKAYNFFCHEPNNTMEKNKMEVISLEDMLKRWIKYSSQKRYVKLPKVENHAGIYLYNFLQKNGAI